MIERIDIAMIEHYVINIIEKTVIEIKRMNFDSYARTKEIWHKEYHSCKYLHKLAPKSAAF